MSACPPRAEFVASEALHHLGVPTTRALSLVGTGADVVRDMFYKCVLVTQVAHLCRLGWWAPAQMWSATCSISARLSHGWYIYFHAVLGRVRGGTRDTCGSGICSSGPPGLTPGTRAGTQGKVLFAVSHRFGRLPCMSP